MHLIAGNDVSAFPCLNRRRKLYLYPQGPIFLGPLRCISPLLCKPINFFWILSCITLLHTSKSDAKSRVIFPINGIKSVLEHFFETQSLNKRRFFRCIYILIFCISIPLCFNSYQDLLLSVKHSKF
jgi:hypothetical protein